MTTSTTTTPVPATRSPRSDDRVAGAAGVLAAVSMVGAFLVLPVDDGGTGPSDIAARYAEGATGFLRAAVLEVVSLGLTAVLVAGLCAWLASRSRFLATSAALGGAVVVTSQLAGYATIATLALSTAESGGSEVVIALYDLSAVLFTVGNAGLAVLAASVAAGALPSHRVVAGWAALTAVAATLGSLALRPEGFFSPHGHLGFLVLLLQLAGTLGAGVALLRSAAGHQR